MNQFKSNTLNIYGEQGKRWLSELPARIEHYAHSLDLSELEPISQLSYNYVMTGKRHNQAIVLKLSLDEERLLSEAIALKAFTGYGTVKVLEHSKGMLLMEQAIPGHALQSYFPVKENESIEIFCKVFKRLHHAPIPSGVDIPDLASTLSNLNNSWNIPESFLSQARRYREELLCANTTVSILHGDLHHNNILWSEDSWVVIDPHPLMIGDPTYDLTAFVRNPIPQLLDYNTIEIVKNRIDLLSRFLSVPASRIYRWSYVQSVLAWTWSLEDHQDVTYHRRFTELLDGLTRQWI